MRTRVPAIAWLLIFVMVFSIVGCGVNTPQNPPTESDSTVQPGTSESESESETEAESETETLNDLTSEKEPKISGKFMKKREFVPFLSVGLVWLVAAVAFFDFVVLLSHDFFLFAY